MLSVYFMQFFFSFNLCVEMLTIKLGAIIFASIYFIFRLTSITADPFYIFMNCVLASIICITLIHFEWR